MDEEKIENGNLEPDLENSKEIKDEVQEDNQNNDKKINEEPKEIEELEVIDEGEQLSILKVARDELSNAYKTGQDQYKTIEKLSTEIALLKEQNSNTVQTIEQLNNELDVLKTREADVEQTTYNKRLEQLSKDFEELGQEKTVEQLSKLSKEVIGEFEEITRLALNNKTEEQLDSVTVPTQTMESKKESITKKPNKKVFSFEGVCENLQNQQEVDGSNSKRTLNM